MVGSAWEYAELFYRVNLKDYISFRHPIDLHELFTAKKTQLITYYERNKGKSVQDKRLLFMLFKMLNYTVKMGPTYLK